jgi:hypothetical protein
MEPSTPRPLPDPWLFDSEALLRELDRCRETILQIPITNANATHFGIELAVNAVWNLTQNLRYLLLLHREQQDAMRKLHEGTLTQALSQGAPNIVRLQASSEQKPGRKRRARGTTPVNASQVA